MLHVFNNNGFSVDVFGRISSIPISFNSIAEVDVWLKSVDLEFPNEEFLSRYIPGLITLQWYQNFNIGLISFGYNGPYIYRHTIQGWAVWNGFEWVRNSGEAITS